MIRFEKLPGDILSRLNSARDVLLNDPEVIFAYLFGGLARGEERPLSDVDIAIFLADGANASEARADLFNRLSDALGTSELDLVILNTAPVGLSGRVLMHRVVLIDKEPFRRHLYESVTLREFFDFRVKEAAILTSRYGVG